MNGSKNPIGYGKRRLLACDLDGTLISDHRSVPACAVRALETAHLAGWNVVISTGRSIAMLPRQLKRSRVVDAYITSNGARVTLRNGRTLLLRPFPPGGALPVWAELSGRGAAVNVFFNETVLFGRRGFQKIFGGRKNLTFDRMGMLLRFLFHSRTERGIRRCIQKNDAAIEKIGGIFPSEENAADALAHIRRFDGITALTTQGNDIEVTADNASKGGALSLLCERFGVEKDDVVVCGDSGNDLSMRAYCGKFVAPHSASKDVLAVADVITDDVRKDGVAKWLLEYLKQEKNNPASF